MLTIDRRFCGPPGSANGGYACGLVASQIEGTAEVRLRAPPPLDTEIELSRRADGVVTLMHGETLLAEGRPAQLSLELPPQVGLARAIDASTRYPGVAFTRCFVCGADRGDDGGLMILPGTVAGSETRGLVAAPWTPATDLGDADGNVDPKFVWSALDCPSWFAHVVSCPPEQLKVALLGQLTAQVERVPRVGETCVVVGWPIKQEGRRIYSASALFDPDGQPIAWSSAIWIELK